MNGRGLKVINEYVQELGRAYADTPKAVYAALALSFAIRLSDEDIDAAKHLLDREWSTLYENGIVPQKPRSEDR